MKQFGGRGLAVSIGDVQVCRHLDFDIQHGDIVAILGGNGVGKTTLLHTLAGLRAADAGDVMLGERPLSDLSTRQRARSLGILFQDDQDPLHASVLQTVLAGRHPFLSAFRGESEIDLQIAHDALRQTGMLEKRDRPVSLLSGGERKRVALAALLTQQPVISLLDEPNTHLDLHYQIASLELIAQHVQRIGGSAIMVLHEVNLALRFCHHALLLFGDGHTLYGPIGEVINSDNLTRLYRHPMREFRDDSRRCFVAD